MLPILFFIFAFLTLAALLYSGMVLLSQEESPLSDRLDDLQSASGVARQRSSR